MKTIKTNLRNMLIFLFVCNIFCMVGNRYAFAQAGKELTWLRVGSLHSWYCNYGCEIELGRTGMAVQQQDGLRWPAQYHYQDCEIAKGMWIGTTNYSDPVTENTYSKKVICVGPRQIDQQYQFMPI
jgi:hypothetical protein